jgi:Predicted dehydrogenases and related proteins
MQKIRLAVIGSGWRALFFLRCAKMLPNLFELCGVVTRNKDRAEQFKAEFGANAYEGIGALLEKEKPEYAVVSVAASAAANVTKECVDRGIPVLLETPAVPELYDMLSKNAPVQVAEQYFLRPMEQARLNYLQKGKLGDVVQARISFCNDYHAVSLIRKYLGVGFENCRITAQKIAVPSYPGYERDGLHTEWELKKQDHFIAVLDYGRAAGIYDYEAMQHRSFIRSQFTQIKGTKGEMMNSDIRYLTAPDAFIKTDLLRHNMGEDVNIEGFGLKGITGDNEWLYRNPFENSRLTDDEIGVAECMARMGEFVHTGKPFYSLANGMQDMYLTRLIKKAAEEGKTIESETRAFAEK